MHLIRIINIFNIFTEIIIFSIWKVPIIGITLFGYQSLLQSLIDMIQIIKSCQVAPCSNFVILILKLLFNLLKWFIVLKNRSYILIIWQTFTLWCELLFISTELWIHICIFTFQENSSYPCPSFSTDSCFPSWCIILVDVTSVHFVDFCQFLKQICLKCIMEILV